jgi:hypothetical protein
VTPRRSADLAFFLLDNRVFHMQVSARDARQMGELGDPVYQAGDLFPEITMQVCQSEIGVFYRIMQQPSSHYGGRDAHLGQYSSHDDAVIDT